MAPLPGTQRDPAGPRGRPGGPGQRWEGAGRGCPGSRRPRGSRDPSAAPRPPLGVPAPRLRPQFPLGPRACLVGAVDRRPRAGVPCSPPARALSPLTSDEDSVREGRCAAGGGSRGPGPAPPAPAARRRPAAAPPAAVPSGRGARVTLGAAREPPHRPLRPAATAPRRSGPRRTPAVRLPFLSLAYPFCEMGRQKPISERDITSPGGKAPNTLLRSGLAPHPRRGTLAPLAVAPGHGGSAALFPAQPASLACEQAHLRGPGGDAAP